MRIVRSIKADIEVASDVNRYLIGSYLFHQRSELLEKALL